MSSYSISKSERIGSGRVEQIVTHTPFVFIIEVEAPEEEAASMARGDTITFFGFKAHVREVLLRDKESPYYRFRVRLNWSDSDIRGRATILRAYETQEVDELASLEPIPF